MTGKPNDAPGSIYAFWITGQPLDQIKIGRTTQKTEERIAEWERSLTPEPGDIVNELFAFETRYNELAERIIHTTLTCEKIGRLRHPRTGRELTEFFRIDNVLLLRLFIAMCVRYADAVGDELNKV